MQKKRILRKLFTRTPAYGASAASAMPLQAESASPKYYRHISELPLRNYIQAAVYNNLNALIISGTPSLEELYESWVNINLQCADAAGNSEHTYYTSLTKKSALLEITYQQITVLGQLLYMCCEQKVFAKNLYKELNSLTKSNFPFSENDTEINRNNIKRCLNRSKSLLIQVQLIKAQIEQTHKKNNNGKPTEKYFKGLLITISDHAGYRITDDIMVDEFYERLHRYNQYCEQVKNMNNGRRK